METILVVDDSVKARQVAAACLRDHGMKALFAENGREALTVLEKRQADAVLTDLQMPEMDGLALVRLLRRTHPRLPVVLMTSGGNEKAAMEALQAGALSYVPKESLRENLCAAMNMVVAAVEVRRHRDRTRELLQRREAHFVIGYELDGLPALVSHLQANLEQLNFCDDVGMFQVSTALGEALINAMDHGNLELDSALREDGVEAYERLRHERSRQLPYRDRRVHVTERMTPDEVTYVVRDEGKGFDAHLIPDPTDGENLLKASGRGLMLIRTFMDAVIFNPAGNEITMVKRRKGSRAA